MSPFKLTVKLRFYLFYFLWSYVCLPVGSEQKCGQHDKTHCQRRTKGTEDSLGKDETRVLPTETAGEEIQFGYRDTTFIFFDRTREDKIF